MSWSPRWGSRATSGRYDPARIERLEVADDVPAIDLSVTHGGSNSSGLTFDSRVFLCNRPTQGRTQAPAR